MRIVVADWETYFDSNTYTLSRMTTESYIRDQKFEALGLGLSHKGKTAWVPQEHIKQFIDSYDWSDVALVMHHAQFDALIFSHHYGIKPKFIFDTISMARVVHGPHARMSLAKLAERYNLGMKTVPYQEFDGKRWYQLSNRVREMLADGCKHDCALTEQLFYHLLPHVPAHELALIDRTVRMFTEPTAIGDLATLRQICNSEVNKKADMMSELNVTASDLQSAPTFQRLLEAEGIEVEYKFGKSVDKKTGEFKKTPAFAKTDEFMGILIDHDNPRVRALAEARLGVKSTLNETRSGRILRMAERGALAMYHHHAGAHTLRVTGGDKMNWVNLPRDGLIRKAIRAPEGTMLSIKDFSQFELRLVLWLAGQIDKLKILASGGDIYSMFGTKLYEREITKADEKERYVSKQVVLGSQYGQGEDKLYNELNFKHKVPVDREFVSLCINVYRKEEYTLVARLWRECTKLLPRIASREEFEWKCFRFKDGKCYAPNGSYMFFENLEWRESKSAIGGGAWFFEKKPGQWVKMYGAKLLENLVQFLQRCMAGDVFLKIDRKYPWILFPYDEGIHVVPKDGAQGIHEEMLRIMSISPSWAPDLPISAEGKVSDCYDK